MLYVGTAAFPPDCKTWPAEPVAVLCSAAVVVVPPHITAYAVVDARPDPPFATCIGFDEFIALLVVIVTSL